MLLMSPNSRIAKKLLFMFLITTLCLLSGINGCVNPPKQILLDDSLLDLLSRGEIDKGYLWCHRNSRFDCELTSEQSREIIKAMIPIRHIGAEEMKRDRVDYTFLFQQGKSPFSFKIMINEDELVVFFDGQKYCGGNKKLFLDNCLCCVPVQEICVPPATEKTD